MSRQLVERDHILGGDVVEPLADRLEGVLIGQDLRRLLEGRILIDGHEHRRRPPTTGDRHVLTAVRDLIQEISEPRPQLPNRHRLDISEVCSLAYDFANPFRFDPRPTAGIAVIRVPTLPGLDDLRVAQNSRPHNEATPARMTFRDTLVGMTEAISVRLDDDAVRALNELEATGLNRSDAVRTALVAAARRLRDRQRLAAEVAALEADAGDRALLRDVADTMEDLRAPW